MHGVALEGAGTLVGLTVPGLAENRPSVLRGDAVVVQRPGDTRRFRGYAHQVLPWHNLPFQSPWYDLPSNVHQVVHSA